MPVYASIATCATLAYNDTTDYQKVISMASKRKHKTPADVVIDELGVRGLARKLNLSPSTIIRWRQRGGRIPSRHHIKIIELSNGTINADALVYGR